MSRPVFMSPEHVERMNQLLAQSAEVLSACAALDRDYELAYELSDGPEGTVYWVLRFDRRKGAAFSLVRPRDADVTFLGNWREVINASQRTRDDGEPPPELDTRGDASALDRVAAAYEAAQRAATIASTFPVT